ncbi:MAG: methyltransferase domain-containing protein [archaeon]
MEKRLNVGCGRDIMNGYVNLDFVKLPGVNVVHDLRKFPWPFKENEFDKIFISHYLEHVDDFERTLIELKRISKNGAIITIRVPHFSCGVTYRDPTHKVFYSYFSFDYYTKNPKRKTTYDKFDELNFVKILDRQLNFTRLSFTFLNKIFNPLINLNPAIYERFFCWILPCSEVLFKMEVIK